MTGPLRPRIRYPCEIQLLISILGQVRILKAAIDRILAYKTWLFEAGCALSIFSSRRRIAFLFREDSFLVVVEGFQLQAQIER